MSDTTAAREIPAPAVTPCDSLDTLIEESRTAYNAGYEAGLVSGREAGYRHGYREGFADGSRPVQRGAAEAARTDEPTGSRLLGLPCDNCGCCFYSDETRCPRCKSPRNQPISETVGVSSN